VIKAVLDSLTDSERRQLMYAFENEFAQYIDLPMGRFIGVNIEPIKHLEIQEKAGVWAYGLNKANGEK
jgi:hypothetical protein